MVGFDLDMTLIDTVPGFAATLRALGGELGVDFPVDRMTTRLGPPLEHLLAEHLAEEAIAAAGDRFRALYPDHAITLVPALAGAHEALAAVRAHRGRVVVVTGKYPANARLHVDHLGLDIDHLDGWVWGVGKAEALRREGATVYVGDHVHDVAGARAAGALSVSVLTGGCTREELLAAGTDVVLEHLGEFPAWLEEHLLTTRLAALEADLRARRSLLVAYSGGADSAFLLAAAVRALGPDRVAAATGYSDSLPRAERDPAREFARSLGVEVHTPRTHEMEREGYRANAGDRCFFCKAELIDVLAPLAAEQGLAHVATGTNADDAVAGFRPGHPRRGRARRDHPAARRRAHQGAGAGGLAPLGPGDLGQAGGGLPVLPGGLRHRGDPAPPGPGRARRGRGPGRARRGRRTGARPAGPRPGGAGLGRGRRRARGRAAGAGCAAHGRRAGRRPVLRLPRRGPRRRAASGPGR